MEITLEDLLSSNSFPDGACLKVSEWDCVEWNVRHTMHLARVCQTFNVQHLHLASGSGNVKPDRLVEYASSLLPCNRRYNLKTIEICVGIIAKQTTLEALFSSSGVQTLRVHMDHPSVSDGKVRFETILFSFQNSGLLNDCHNLVEVEFLFRGARHVYFCGNIGVTDGWPSDFLRANKNRANCRLAVIALLALKKRKWFKIDRNLLTLIARMVWARKGVFLWIE